MKELFRFFLVCLFAVCGQSSFAQAIYKDITSYRAFYAWARHAPQDWMVIRQFIDNSKTYLLLVNPQTLETKIDEPGFYQIRPMSIDEARIFFKSAPYIKALQKAEKQSLSTQDAGIESGLPKQTGISLTADLCPSHKPLDRRIFTSIVAEFKKVEQPVPVALSVTGIWMRQHANDLDWLKKLQAENEIYITWINHSFNHRVSPRLPLKENFLLEAGTNINYEVLETEMAMLKNGLLPSVFFRFPGLVSDKDLVYRITDFGLIPIGTDAWLAKGQQPKAGSIVLIHGNGNEPVGVDDFLKLLKTEARSVAKKQWLLYDLRESVDQEFQGE